MGGIVKTVTNIGKKLLPAVPKIFKGIGDIFGGGGGQPAQVEGPTYGPQTPGQSFGGSIRDFGGGLRDTFNAFRGGGFGGGMRHLMDGGAGRMIDAGRDMFNSGRSLYNQGRSTYEQMRGGDYEGASRGFAGMGRDIMGGAGVNPMAMMRKRFGGRMMG